MRYTEVVPCTFLRRPNRFVAQVLLNGAETTVHVKNTGRCRELLVPGCTAYLARGENPARKTAWDLVAVEKGHRLINLDAQAPNAVAAEWLLSGGLWPDLSELRREVTWEDSRFDLLATHGGTATFVEVKGVTLEEEGVVRFPDAPSLRAVKHLHGLTRLAEAGRSAMALFVVQMAEVRCFQPNRAMQPAFADALQAAARAGVQLLAMDCAVTPDSLAIRQKVPIELI